MVWSRNCFRRRISQHAIKFLIENEVIVIDNIKEPTPEVSDAQIIIPNGNYDVTGAGFYSPLNLEIPIGSYSNMGK